VVVQVVHILLLVFLVDLAVVLPVLLVELEIERLEQQLLFHHKEMMVDLVQPLLPHMEQEAEVVLEVVELTELLLQEDLVDLEQHQQFQEHQYLMQVAGEEELTEFHQ